MTFNRRANLKRKIVLEKKGIMLKITVVYNQKNLIKGIKHRKIAKTKRGLDISCRSCSVNYDGIYVYDYPVNSLGQR